MKPPAFLGSSRVWIVVGLAVVGALWVRSYGDARAYEAVSLARADSLAWAFERHDSLEISRDSARGALEAAVGAWDVERARLDARATQAAGRSRANLARLSAILADSGVVTDTVRVLVMATLGGLQNEMRICGESLRVCDATQQALRSRIVIDSTTLVERGFLLGEYQVQLDAALKNRRRPAGAITWLQRALATYAIVQLGGELLRR